MYNKGAVYLTLICFSLCVSLRTKRRGTVFQSIGSRLDPLCLALSVSSSLTCVRGETKFSLPSILFKRATCYYIVGKQHTKINGQNKSESHKSMIFLNPFSFNHGTH